VKSCLDFLLSLALLCLLVFAPQGFAQPINCTVKKAPTDEAAQAFLKGDYANALNLYSAAAKSNPKDVEAIAGQMRSLLEEQEVSAAADLAEKSIASHQPSAVLATALGEVRFRQGLLDDALRAYQISLQLDACSARTHYDAYRILWVKSMRGSAFAQLQAAHQLDPSDPDIRLAWIEHLPLAARAMAIDQYLKSATDEPVHDQENLKGYSDRLHAILAAKNSGCQLVASSATTTTLPFRYILADSHDSFSGLGFDMEVNNKASVLLELDTGASGILVNRSVARKAGLVPVTTVAIAGIGDEKNMKGYWAFADDLHIGSLEFKNCMVEVSDKRSIGNVDGLIGADVFEDYHVQLDFPLRRMTLSPLPARPGDSALNRASLNANGVGNAATATTRDIGDAKAADAKSLASIAHYTDRYVSPEMESWSPFDRFGHQILITGYLKDKKPRLFLLDSGSNNSVLDTAAAKNVGKIHGDSLDRVDGLNGRVKKIYTENNVDVVFANLRDPLRTIVVMDLDQISKADGTEVSSIIGLDTLLVLTVDIDYRDGLIHLVYDPKHGANLAIGTVQ
jgi:tetratricopeptide (TPR) repeat protein